MNEITLIESPSLRSQLCKDENASALERVGQLVTLAHNGWATTKQVAEFYKVDERHIRMLVTRHKDEFDNCGYKMLKKKEITEQQDVALLSLFISRTKSIAIFSRAAVLLCGGLLRDSEVAKVVRAFLIQVAQNFSPAILSRFEKLEMQNFNLAKQQNEMQQRFMHHLENLQQQIQELLLQNRELIQGLSEIREIRN